RPPPWPPAGEQLDRDAHDRPCHRPRGAGPLLRLLGRGHGDRSRGARPGAGRGRRAGPSRCGRRRPRADGAPMSDLIKAPSLMHVGGEWVPATSGAVLESVDPTTEEVLGTVPDAGPEDVAAAVAAAREAAPGWAALGWKRRAA